MSKYYHPETDFLRKLDVPLPTAEEHGTEEEIRANMKQLLPRSWKLAGNTLIGETEVGPLVQTIPTDYILTGTDKAGLPIFKRIVL